MKKILDFILFILGLVSFLLIFIFPVCFLFWIFDEFTKKSEYSYTEKVYLYSINLDDSISGSFALGSGRIDSNYYYVCYKKNSDDSLSLIKYNVCYKKNSDDSLSLIKYNVSYTKIYQILENSDLAYADVDYNGFDNIIEIRLYLPKDTVSIYYDLNLTESDV